MCVLFWSSDSIHRTIGGNPFCRRRVKLQIEELYIAKVYLALGELTACPFAAGIWMRQDLPCLFVLHIFALSLFKTIIHLLVQFLGNTEKVWCFIRKDNRHARDSECELARYSQGFWKVWWRFPLVFFEQSWIFLVRAATSCHRNSHGWKKWERE